MIDWCARHGLNIFQTLPINETSDDNSPYNAISSLAIEPTTIAIAPQALPDITAMQIKQITKPALLAELRTGSVNHPKVKALKRKLLDAAFANFLGKHFNKETKRALQFRSFLMENAEWLSDYALFRVLMEGNGGLPAADMAGPRSIFSRKSAAAGSGSPSHRFSSTARRRKPGSGGSARA
jgi:4-alpha-glucanotransferase